MKIQNTGITTFIKTIMSLQYTKHNNTDLRENELANCY